MTNFDGNYDLLPLQSHLRYGAVPSHPTNSDFHRAATVVASNESDPAAHWFFEAVRAMRSTPGRTLEEAKGDINRSVSDRLFRIDYLEREAS